MAQKNPPVFSPSIFIPSWSRVLECAPAGYEPLTSEREEEQKLAIGADEELRVHNLVSRPASLATALEDYLGNAPPFRPIKHESI